MDQRDLAQQDPEVIRHQIDETRSSITEKLEALEEQVIGTVQDARETVEDTIQSAKDTMQSAKETVQETIETVRSSVEDTMQSVKHTFDVNHQVRQHPWPMMGASFLAGVAGAVLYDNLRNRGREDRPASYQPPELRSEHVRQQAPPEPSSPGWSDIFREEIDKAKGVAVGYLMALARDWAKQNFPDLAPQIDDFMHGATEKLGGSPIDHAVLHEAYDAASRQEANPFSRH